MILALAAQKQWKLHQVNIKMALVYGKLNDEVYMEIPQGFEDSEQPSKVCKLKKILYGLKQDSKVWYSGIGCYFSEIGLTKSSADFNLYYSFSQGKYIIVLLYVDDLIVIGDDIVGVEKLKHQMENMFEMSELGKHNFILELNYCMKTLEFIFINVCTSKSYGYGSIYYIAILSQLPCTQA